jgi:inner membrane protein
MKNLLNVPVIWFLAGFAFFLLEFVVPGLVFFFFAVGAWVVALLTMFLDLSFNAQLVTFLISSGLSILLLRKWLKKVIASRRDHSEVEDEFVGKTALAETFIGPENEGMVSFRGTTWRAYSEDTIQKGELVVIVGNQSIKLFVKSKKTHNP